MKRITPLITVLLYLNLFANAQAIHPYTTCPDVNIAIARAGVNADNNNPVFLYNVNQATGAMTLVPGGPFKDPLNPSQNLRVNGIGVNKKDGFIYGLVNDGTVSTARFVRLDQQYVVTSFGNIAPPTSPTGSVGIINAAAGEVDPSGNYYFTALTVKVTTTGTSTVTTLDKLFLGKIADVASLSDGNTPTVTYNEIQLTDANCAGYVTAFTTDPANAGLQDFSYNSATHSFFSYLTFKSPGATSFTGQMIELRPTGSSYQAFCTPVTNTHSAEVAGTLIDKSGNFTILLTDGSFGSISKTSTGEYTGVFTPIATATATGLPNPLRGDMATCGQELIPVTTLVPFTTCPNVNLVVARAGINKDSTNPYYLYTVNTTTGNATQLSGGPLLYPTAPYDNIQINGVGVNTKDGFVYGLVGDTASNDVSLIKFGQNYGVKILGTVAPPPGPAGSESFVNTAAGDMDRSDNFYFTAITVTPGSPITSTLYLGKIAGISTLTGAPAPQYFPVDVSEVNCFNYISTFLTDPNNSGIKDFSYNPTTNTFISYVTYKLPGEANYVGQMIELRPVAGSSPLTYKMYCTPIVRVHTAEVAGTLIDNNGNFEVLFTDGTIGKIQKSGSSYTGVFEPLGNMTCLPNPLRGDMASCGEAGTIIVPVTLSSFTASAKDCNNTFTWVAENEIDFAGYDLEQSVDNVHFIKVASVPAKHTMVSTTYQISVPSPGKKALYRLKMNDMDGKFVYSKILSISNSCSTNVMGFTVYPSPAKSTLGLSWYGVDKPTVFDITIYSLDGRAVIRTTETVAAGGNLVNLNVSTLQPGAYYIRATNTGNHTSIAQKFIKQ